MCTLAIHHIHYSDSQATKSEWESKKCCPKSDIFTALSRRTCLSGGMNVKSQNERKEKTYKPSGKTK